MASTRVLASLLVPSLLIAAAAGCRETSRVPEPMPIGPRSLLLITLDTTRADRLSPYGGDVETPNLAALATRGVVFERAYATAPVTLPAHTSLFTGLYPPAHGVRNNGIHAAAPELDTLAERLQVAGWNTAAFVSAAVLERRFGLDQGFATYDDDLSGGKPRGLRMIAEREAAVTVDAARGWLDRLPDGERFFLWVHLFDPHAAYDPPEPWRRRYAGRLYDGEIAAMDAEIGRLLAHPLLAAPDGPAVVAIGDHGEALGEHGEQTHAMLAYDSTLRVPFLFAVPGGPQGLRIADPVSQIDLLPTLLALLGLPAEPALPGLNLLPRLAGQPLAALTDRGLYSEAWAGFYSYGWAKQRVLRRGGHKLYEAPTSELYAYLDDPAEREDRHAREGEVAARLAAEIAGTWGPIDAAGRESAAGADAEVTEKLRSLGYLGGVGQSRRGPRPDPKRMIALHESIQVAGELLHRRAFADAVRELRGVLAEDPENLNVLKDLAVVLAELDRLEDAVAAAERALALDAANPLLQLALASIESRRGNHQRALELAELSAATNPNALEAWTDRAEYLRLLGRRDDAAALLDEARDRFGDKPLLAVRIAQWVDLPAGHLEAAEAALRAAVARDPYLVDGWRALGETLERAGRSDEAIATYRQALGHQPADAALVGRLGKLLASLRHPDAEATLRQALALAPAPPPDLLTSLADALTAQGRPDAARAALEQAATSQPTTPAEVNARAIALLRLGRAGEAENALRELLSRQPNDAAAHNNLASLAVARRDWPTAERAARAAVTSDPGLASGWNNLGIAREEQRDLDAAADAYEHALRVEPAYWQAAYNLALLHLRRGERSAAADALRQVLARRPDHAKSHLELGRLLAGDPATRDDGRHHLETAQRLAGSRAEGREANRLLAALADRAAQQP